MNRAKVRGRGYFKAIALVCALFSPPSYAQDRTIEILTSQALSAYQEGRFDSAEALSREAFERTQAQNGIGTQETVGALTLWAASLRAKGDSKAAIDLYSEFLPRLEAELGPDNPLTVDVISDMAQAFEETGDLDQALSFNLRAARARQALLGQNHPDTLLSLNNTAIVLDKIGQTDAAAKLLTEVISRSTATLGAEAEATLESQVSLALMLDKLTRYSDAEAVHAKTTAAVEKVFGPAHRVTINQKLNHAINLMIQGRPQEAVPLLQEALRYQPELFGPGDRATTTTRAILGGALIDLGRIDEALEIYADNLRYSRLQNGPDGPENLTPLGNYANALMLLEKWDEAAAINAERLRIARLWLPEGHSDVALIKHDMAGALGAMGRWDEAVILQREAVRELERALGEGHPLTVSAQVALAEMLDHEADFDEAEREHRKAVANASTQMASPVHPLTLRATSNYVSFLQRNGLAADAIPMLRKLAKLTEIAQGPDSAEAARANERLVSALLNEDMAFDALAYGRMSLAARLSLAQHRAIALGDASTSNDLAKSAWTMAHIVQTALTADDATLARQGLTRDALQDEAFQAGQTQGFDIAGQAIRRAAARSAAIGSGLEQIVSRWETVLQARLDTGAVFAGIAARTEADQNELAAVLDDRRRLGDELSDLEDEISRRFPQFGALMSPRPVPLNAVRNQDLLRPDEALILLAPSPFSDGSWGHIWAVTNEGMRYADLPVTGAELSDQISRFHALLSQRAIADVRAPVPSTTNSSVGVLPFDAGLAYQLYSELFGDPAIADLIASKETWIIAPQGSLLSLPFAALLSAPPVEGPMTAQTLRDAPWLGMRRNLAIVPSVSALKLLRTPGRGDGAGWDRLAYLGIGDPVFDGAPAPFRGIDAEAMRTAETRRDAVRGLPRLPGTAREIAALQRAFPPDRVLTLTGTAASESQLDRLSGDGTLASAGIVHFATHGLLAGSLSGQVEPALALTPPAKGVAVIGPWQTDDGLLLASEISQLRMNADWVVLSACNTAAGDRADAQGLSGLARAFFFAGAKALLVTHWAVEDDVAASLMEDTVKNAGGSVSRAEALRAAMVKVIADTSRDKTALPMSHPSVWAPFQLVGAPD